MKRTQESEEFDETVSVTDSAAGSQGFKISKKKGKTRVSKSELSSLPPGVISEKDILPLQDSQVFVSSTLTGTIDESLYQVPQSLKAQRSPRTREEGYISGGHAGTVFGSDDKKSSSALRADPDMSSLTSRRQRSALREIRKAHDTWERKKEDNDAEIYTSTISDESPTKISIPSLRDKVHPNDTNQKSFKSTATSSPSQSSKKSLKPLNLQGIYTVKD